jgi:hypothetical protein
MAEFNLNEGGKLRVERAELDVPHLRKILTFVLPPFAGSYEKVMEDINTLGLYLPTTAEVVSLVDIVHKNLSETHCADLFHKLLHGCLLTSTETLAFSKGVLVYDNIDGKMPLSRDGLLDLFSSGDKRVRLVSSGFPGHNCKDMHTKEFLKNPYALAQLGDKMNDIAERYSKTGYPKRMFISSDVPTLSENASDVHANTRVWIDRSGGSLNIDRWSSSGYAVGLKRNEPGVVILPEKQ